MSKLIEASRQYLDGDMEIDEYLGYVLNYLETLMDKKEVVEIAKFVIRQGRR